MSVAAGLSPDIQSPEFRVKNSMWLLHVGDGGLNDCGCVVSANTSRFGDMVVTANTWEVLAWS